MASPLRLVPPLLCVLACASPTGREDDSTTASSLSTSADEVSTSESASDDSESASDDSDSSGAIKLDQGTLDLGDNPSCDPELIPDTTEFTFVKSIELGIDTLQAGFYDGTRDRVVVFSFFGEGRVLDVDGTILANVQAPAEALPALDGGAYDFGSDIGLLINQACDLVEIDPETFTTLSVTPLAAAHGMSVCAGLAIDPFANLYIASYGTDELVVVDRTGSVEVRRVDMLAIGMSGFDGIAEIAGSDNFLVNSTTQLTAAIITAEGQLVAGPGPVGVSPIMGGGAVGQPDSMLTICNNGHTWVCDAYETTCSDFAPSDGDKQACDCLVAVE